VGFREWFAVVGEVGGDYQTIQTQFPSSSFTMTSRTHIYSFLGGPRVALPATRRARIFGQVLLGATRRETSVTDPLIGEFSTMPFNHFVWQPGGGVEIGAGRHAAIFFEGDYRLTPMPGLLPPRTAITQPRFSSGIVYRP
jgi:hypothetical protein